MHVMTCVLGSELQSSRLWQALKPASSPAPILPSLSLVMFEFQPMKYQWTHRASFLVHSFQMGVCSPPPQADGTQKTTGISTW